MLKNSFASMAFRGVCYAGAGLAIGVALSIGLTVNMTGFFMAGAFSLMTKIAIAEIQDNVQIPNPTGAQLVSIAGAACGICTGLALSPLPFVA